MPKEFTLPDLGEGIAEAQIVRLLIKEGDAVTEDQYLMEVETDKAAVEIPSPYAGIAMTIHVREGQTVNVGDVMVTFDEVDAKALPARGAGAAAAVVGLATAVPPGIATGAAPAVAEATPPPAHRKTTVPAAPVVRKLARELGVDLGSIRGSGPGGRITREDVKLHAGGVAPGSLDRESLLGPHTGAEKESPTRRPVLQPADQPPGIADVDKWGPIRRVPLNQIRKTIAAKMSQSASTIPHVTQGDEADVTELDRMRRSLNEATNNDPKLTLMSFLIRATCIALRKYPILNASFDDEGGQIIYKDYFNIGIAVDTQRGLIVPVIRDADRLSLRGIAAAVRTIAERVRTNQFGIEDLRGGTFTISNVGALGGTFSTPIINHPEVAILGLGRSRRVPVIRNGEVAEGLVLPLNVSFDHRAIDGATAALFTREIISYLETPAKFVLD